MDFDTCLARMSRGDDKFYRRKRQSLLVSQLYGEGFSSFSDGVYYFPYRNIHDRMSNCATYLSFRKDSEGTLKLYRANFCRLRFCPMCQWRKTLFWQSRILNGLPSLLEYLKYDDPIFLLITLTIKNVKGLESIKNALNIIPLAFKKILGNGGGRSKSLFPSLGWIKSIEVTCGSNNSYHPHLHTLMLMKSDYFSKLRYITIEELAQAWGEACSFDYNPSVSIRRVVVDDDSLQVLHDNVTKSMMEVVKYCMKPVEIQTMDRSWLISLTEASQKKKFITMGGCFRNFFSVCEGEEDLIHIRNDKDSSYLEKYGQLQFYFNENHARYFQTN